MFRLAVKRPRSYFLPSRCYGYVHVPKKTTPHLLGHGSVWRKCFVVHPSIEASDCLHKFQRLTGTDVVQGLPEPYNKAVLPSESLVKDTKQSVIEYLLLQNEEGFSMKAKWWRSGILDGILQAILSSVWRVGDKYPHIVDSYWTCKPKVECYWRNTGKNYITLAEPLAILHTTSPLKLWCDPTYQINKSCPLIDTKFPSTSYFGLFEHSFDEINVFGGNKYQSSYPFAHTIFVQNRSSNSIEQTKAHSLMQLFAQSAAQTIQSGFPLDEDLYYPLSCQAILTDGHKYTFSCYQLNTLNLTTNRMKNNFFWIGPTLTMYDNLLETIDVNEECIALILKFLLNRPLRKRPSQSGFKMSALQNIAKKELMMKKEGSQ